MAVGRGKGRGARLEGRETSFELLGAGIKGKDRHFNVIVLFFYGLRPGRFAVVVNHGESFRSVKTFNLKRTNQTLRSRARKIFKLAVPSWQSPVVFGHGFARKCGA